jgi:Tfp pilus assembly protein PilX
MKRRPVRRRDRGMLLGIVLVLVGVIMLAGVLAISSVRSDTASAGADRLSRQLLDCAEWGLEYGKQYFATVGDYTPYLSASAVCASSSPLTSACAPKGPLRVGTGAGPTAITYPLTQTVQMGSQSVQFYVAIYDNDEQSEGTTQNYFQDSDGQVVVYSRCVDPLTNQSKSVQAAIRTTVPTNIDYAGQAGFGFRNQGNQN